MIGSRAKESIVANSTAKKVEQRALINLKNLPLKKGDGVLTNKDVYLTSGVYWVRYKPLPAPEFKETPFVIKSDLYPNSVCRFKNYQHLIDICKIDAKMKWMLENTTFKKSMVNIAKQHRGMTIPFVLDITKYKSKLSRQGNKRKNFLQEVE
jgi:hypothetical protein